MSPPEPEATALDGVAPPPAAEGAAHPLLALGAALLTVGLWSTNFPVLRYVLGAYEPGQVAFLRCAFAGLAMLAFGTLTRMRPPAWRDVPAFALFGLSGMSLSSLGLAHGLRTVEAGAGAFVIGMIPVFAALLARRFLHERLNWAGWGGIALSLAGVVVIGFGEGGGLNVNSGVAFLAGSAFAQAIFYVFQKPYLRRYSPAEVTAYVVIGGAIWLAYEAPGALPRMAAVPWPATALLAFQGTFPIALAFVLWSFALRRAKAAHVTSTVYLMPGLSLLIAFAWLGEVPAPLSLAGGGLALGGVALLNVWGR